MFSIEYRLEKFNYIITNVYDCPSFDSFIEDTSKLRYKKNVINNDKFINMLMKNYSFMFDKINYEYKTQVEYIEIINNIFFIEILQNIYIEQLNSTLHEYFSIFNKSASEYMID